MDLSLQNAAERIEQRLDAIERRLAAIEANMRKTETPDAPAAEQAPRRGRK